MKLTIGENIRNFRKKNDLTQDTFANRLGVTYQSVSRWENGTTYPDLELIPAIAQVLAVSVDELLGIPQIEKEKRAIEAFDELRREYFKKNMTLTKSSLCSAISAEIISIASPLGVRLLMATPRLSAIPRSCRRCVL